MDLKILNTDNMCSVTKGVVKDFNSMSDVAFKAMYQCSKKTFYKRVMKYGDPYMNAPLAKFGKFLAKHVFK